MSRRQEEYNPKKVFVGNLDPRTTKADLEEFLRPFGRFNVWIATSPPGFAFVHFEDERDATEAVRQMNGKDLLGRTLRVEISTGVSKRGRAHDQYTERRGHRSPSPSNRRDKSPGRYHGMPAPMDSPYAAYPYPPYGYPPHYPYPPSSYPPYGGGYPPATFHGSDPRGYSDDRQRRRDSGLCFHCNKPGHFARQCPEKTDRDRERDRERTRDRDRRSRSRSRSRSRGDRRDRGEERHHRHEEPAAIASSATHSGGHDPDGLNNSAAAPIATNSDSSLSASHSQPAADSFQQHEADHSGYSAASHAQ